MEPRFPIAEALAASSHKVIEEALLVLQQDRLVPVVEEDGRSLLGC